ncbi:MAG TPA: anthranilate synthase component I family protein [Candidatus Omnitrophota bacterium]|nr:anthranilate synthase component I family protein [Candidatus Omnitrophota bacterium]
MPHIETYRSPQTPWEVFQKVYSKTKVCFFLDSPRYAPPDQVYSYMGMDPVLEISLVKDVLSLKGEVNEKYPGAQIFPVLRKIFEKHRISSEKVPPFFSGGLAGYFSYEFAPFCDKIRFRQKTASGTPQLYLGLFKKVIVYDHKKMVYYLVANARESEAQGRDVQKLKEYFQEPAVEKKRHFQLKQLMAEMSQKEVEQMVRTAKEYIAAGDIYQTNLSQRFSFGFSGSSLELYGKLRTINPSPFCNFFKAGDLEIISSSPERLIRKRGDLCETRPIAGTCPVLGPRNRFREWRKKLIQNEKEKAEHLMLVDLERNDLGRVCDYRSVQVKEFMVLEKYSHVVHIVSKIIGKLRKGKDVFDLIKAMFPGGTITGCPKIRCMEIIDELEPVSRGIYTGSLGYLDFYGNMDLNIVIRTIILKKRKGFLQVGAGIVYDSDPKKEYEETLHKAEALVKALSEASV